MESEILDENYNWLIEYIDEISQNEFVNKKDVIILLDKIRRKIGIEFDDILDHFEELF